MTRYQFEKINNNLRERPKGKWLHDGSEWKYRFLCSECGYKLMGEEPTNYCPNCGVDMREEVSRENAT